MLIFAGAMTHCRTSLDVSGFNSFLKHLPHKHKIVVGGNHDHILARNPHKAGTLLSEAVYLLDESVVIEGVTIPPPGIRCLIPVPVMPLSCSGEKRSRKNGI